MQQAEAEMGLAEGETGAWPVMLEAELRILDHYQPVLGLPDTLKAKALAPIRETLASQVAALGNVQAFHFEASLNALKEKYVWGVKLYSNFKSFLQIRIDFGYIIKNRSEFDPNIYLPKSIS